MSVDTVQRVKAIKKWLEKAEASYTSHKDISGELNLIMAQAEMQRLKETRRPSSLKKWGLRGAAMMAAVMIFAGARWMTAPAEKPATVVPPAAEITVTQDAPPNGEIPKAPAPVETISEAPAAESVQPQIVEEAPAPQEYTAPVIATVEAAEPAVSAPVLSESEIQSVVGEAGRALRGQS